MIINVPILNNSSLYTLKFAIVLGHQTLTHIKCFCLILFNIIYCHVGVRCYFGV